MAELAGMAFVGRYQAGGETPVGRLAAGCHSHDWMTKGAAGMLDVTSHSSLVRGMSGNLPRKVKTEKKTRRKLR